MPGPLILHYHALGEVARQHDPYELVVSPAAFRGQIERVRAMGYRFVLQHELARALAQGEPAARICSITFDDGTADNATVLPPLLDELSVPVTIYVCPGLLGRDYPFAEPEAGLRIMDRDELLATAVNPRVEIGSHTREHTVLEHATAAEADAEMGASRADLEELLGGPVHSFAYPNCLYSPACPPAAQRAGYTSAVTCGRRGGAGLFEMRRESPSPRDGRLRFELKARGRFHDVWELPPMRAARTLNRARRRLR